MGCISSKFLVASDLSREISTQHVVSLTSTTYGVLNLDRNSEKLQKKEDEDEDEDEEEEEKEEEVVVGREKEKQISNVSKVNKISPLPSSLFFTPQSKKRVLKEEPSEIINTWELMKDLNSDSTIWSPAMKPTKPPTPKSTSSKKQKKSLLGKENISPKENNSSRILRPFSSSANRQSSKLVIDVKARTLVEKDCENVGSRRSLSPLFDPYENANVLLDSYEKKCPPNGENALVFYSTTLRGIRKTFEDCNVVRSIIEAYDVKIVERDISMDSGFKEELRVLMGKMTVTPPLLFVKGRLIGGAEEVLKLEDEGKLGLLLDGIAKKESLSCDVCGGMKFVMCRKCNGSCKVMNEEEKKTVKCGECNENGLIHCSLCC